MTYIYLNTYEGGYLYVGQRTWEGEGIDPRYYGSSAIAKRLGWKPIKREILEVVSYERRLVAEDYWITKYAKEFGIADCALVLANNSRHWHKQFKAHGLMLNLQTSSAESAHSPESVQRALKKRIDSGAQERSQKAATAARDKAFNTMKRNATQYKCIAPNGDVFVGSNSEVGQFVNNHGADVRPDGVLSQIKSGKFQSPHLCVKGALKGFIFEILCKTL